MNKQAKNSICLWYDGDAEDAARFYAKTFPDSSVGAVYLAPGNFPSGKKGASALEPVAEVGEGIKVATVQDPFGNRFGIIENPNFKVLDVR